MALVLPVELLVMTVSTVPPANSQFLALSTVSIATTWLMVAVWFRAARLVFQAFKVHTNFRKLTLYPRQTSNGDKKTYHTRGHLSYPKKVTKLNLITTGTVKRTSKRAFCFATLP